MCAKCLNLLCLTTFLPAHINATFKNFLRHSQGVDDYQTSSCHACQDAQDACQPGFLGRKRWKKI